MNCTKCQAELKPDAKFCGVCGTPVVTAKPRFCGMCGTPIAETDGKFCANCQAKRAVAPPIVPEPPIAQTPVAPKPPIVQTPIAPEPPIVQPPIAPKPPIVQPPIAPKPPIVQTPVAPKPPIAQTPVAPEPPKVKRKRGKWIVLILILFLTVAGGTFYLAVTGRLSAFLPAFGGSSEEPSSIAEPVSEPPIAAVPIPPEAESEQPSMTPSQAAQPAAVKLTSDAYPADWNERINQDRTKFQVLDTSYLAVLGVPQIDKTFYVPTLNAQQVDCFQDGLARVKTDNGLWTFMDTDFHLIAEPNYKELDYFFEGFAAAANTGGHWGYLDRSGHVSGSFQWDSAAAYHDGLAIVSKGNKFGMVDLSQQPIITPQYDALRSYADGLIPAARGDRWGYIDRTNSVVIPFDFEDAGPFVDGLAVVKLNGKCGFIDIRGDFVIPAQYSDAWSFTEDGHAIVQIDDRYGLIDRDGRELIPLEWDKVWDFREGVATVQLGQQFGYVRSGGESTVPAKYHDVWSSSFGLIPVQLTADSKWGYIDRSGHTILDPIYDEAYTFMDGVARVRINGKYGLISITGEPVSDFSYLQMGFISEGYCPVQKSATEWGYIKIDYAS